MLTQFQKNENSELTMNNKKITLQEIADRSGLSIGVIHGVFNGAQPGGKVVRRLIEAFGLDTDLVLYGTPFQIKEAINKSISEPINP